MSEIVIIKTTGQVGVVRSVLTNSATGEEVVEVQPVGRAHGFNRFVPRADVETAGRPELHNAVVDIVILAISEIEGSLDGIHDISISEAAANVRKSIFTLRNHKGVYYANMLPD